MRAVVEFDTVLQGLGLASYLAGQVALLRKAVVGVAEGDQAVAEAKAAASAATASTSLLVHSALATPGQPVAAKKSHKKVRVGVDGGWGIGCVDRASN